MYSNTLMLYLIFKKTSVDTNNDDESNIMAVDDEGQYEKCVERHVSLVFPFI